MLLLDPIKFRGFSGANHSNVGVVVTLAPSPSGDQPLVVVGACAAVKRDKSIKELNAVGLTSPNWEASVTCVLQHYPAGTSAAGIWVRVEQQEDREAESRAHLILKHTKLKDIFKNWPLLFLSVCGAGDDVSVQSYLLNPTSSPLKRTRVEGVAPADMTVSRYLSHHTALLRVRASLPLYIIGNNRSAVEVQKPITSLTEWIRSQSTSFLLNPEQLLFSESSKDTLRTVLPEKSKAAGKVAHGNQHMAHVQDKPLGVEMLESTAPEEETDLPFAPTLRFGEPLKEGCVLITVPVDTLGLVRWDSTLGSIALCLKDRICSQLEAIRNEILWKADSLYSISVHHYTLDSQDCPITIAYPDIPLAPSQAEEEEPVKSLTNQELKTQQTMWRRLFGLPSKSSHLRILSRRPVGGELDWIASLNIHRQGGLLLDPHLTLKHTRVQGGRMELVRGSYLYHHYMQDGFNDNGWGCAYRSLQTLWSWFLLQGHTERPVPTHMQIQEALVKVGDKERHFVGSKEWIGSFEVSTVLNQLLGVECRIHYSSSGGDLGGAGRVLLAHFQAEGTPVMIGGGVLAHTILGVDFSTTTGEIQFLILDPHYTGRGDLKTILDKGWCGWKPLTFWDNTAHYNMCMPLVPEQ